MRFPIDRTALVLALAALMIVPPAAATHNSAGTQLHVIEPDEVGPDGQLQPDIPDGHLYDLSYHENLETPRPTPTDQTGDRYTDCEKGSSFSDAGSYKAALRDGQACYVGFIDLQFEYIFVPASPSSESDTLYPVNPQDGYCTGSDDPNQDDEIGGQDTPAVDGGGAVDETLARAARADDPECAGDGHTSLAATGILVDTDLMEAPAQTVGSTAVGTDPGSGALSFPLAYTPYVYLFGQPHPDNPSPSSFDAGSGVFGPSPLAGGSPLADLTGACGDRTQACTLLTPTDLLEYDANGGNIGEAAGFGEKARLCLFTPNELTVNPAASEVNLCGPFGSRMGDFVGKIGAGGLGVGAGPDTWVSNLPGWYTNSLFINSEADSVLRFSGEYIEDPVDQQLRQPTWPFYGVYEWEDETDGYPHPLGVYFAAVNPKVPTGGHQLWCARPNLLAEGTGDPANGISASDDGDIEGGLYGDYIVDAIDADIYVSPYRGAYMTALGATHGPVTSITGPVESIAQTDDIDASANDVSLGGIDFGEATQTAGLGEGPGEQADYIERDEAFQAEATFSKDVTAGLRCDAQGKVNDQDSGATVPGALDIDASLSQGTVDLKDPTLLPGGMPAREDQTRNGAWQTDVYSFSGQIRGLLDTNEDGDFDACTVPNGRPQPSRDFCPWQPLWDAYNPECSNDEATQCKGILAGNGYEPDASTGVGLYFVLEVTGPMLLVDTRTDSADANTRVLGENNPTAQNCVVGTSTGFAEKLVNHLPGASSIDEIPDALCEGSGAKAIVTDAFGDQSADSPGFFSAAISWAKLTPTPDAVPSNTGGLASTDHLSVTSVFTVGDGGADDMAGLGSGGAFGSGVHTLTDEDPFASS